MSAEHDRDRWLEGALKHELGAEASVPPGDACLDAETVAAWMDGGLEQGSIAMAEAHASNCARCQALLATTIRTAPAAAAAKPATARLWRWWFAPLAATAAAVTIWMVVPQHPAVAPVIAPAVEQSIAPSAAPQELAKSEPAPPPGAAASARNAELGKARVAEAPARADAVARKKDAQSPPALEARKAESAKVADAAAEAPFAAAAPAPPPAVAQRAQGALLGRVAATAQSSPSPDVIWSVGRGGVVMLATDGRTFARVPFPETTDLVAVTATDARQAVVTTADGRIFRTDDGGRSWRRP